MGRRAVILVVCRESGFAFLGRGFGSAAFMMAEPWIKAFR